MNGDSEQASYSISSPGVRYHQSGTIAVNSTVIIELPDDVIATLGNHKNKGIYLAISSNKVNVIGQSVGYGGSPTDTYTALSIRNLCVAEYVYYGMQVVSYSSNRIGTILIVGTEDNTIMKLNAPVTEVVSINTDDTTTILTPDKQYTFVINRLQTVLIRSQKDFTGTKIVTNKPVSVFSGHECTQIPWNVGGCDHLIEQVPPTTLWGRVYYTTPLATRRSYTIKVLAAYNSTNVDIYCNGMKTSYVLNEGMNINKSLHFQEHCVVFSDKKALVVLFSHGTHDDNDGNIKGDPMMLVLPSVDQYLNAFSTSTIRNPGRAGYEYFVNVIVLVQYYQPDTIHLISGGVNKSLDTQEWVPVKVNNVIEAYATKVTISEGVVEVIHTNTSALMTTIVYGFANAVGYGHSGGVYELEIMTGI